MYEQQFGLKRHPFRGKSVGTDVFVGPQTARVLTSLKKAFAVSDASVAIVGAAGTGKTTAVERALESFDNRKIIRFGRATLGHDEVLDFLLEEFDATDVPKSTIKKIHLFKQLLTVHTDAGTRVFVVVEDAVRIGDDALAELESLTAADGDLSNGANLVLMGDPGLERILQSPSLVRLNQRTRLRLTLEPLPATELIAYLKHCVRNAGGELDLLFDADAQQLAATAAAGIPRVANTLVDAVLTEAAGNQLSKIDAELVRKVAGDELGIKLDAAPAPDPAPAVKTADVPELIQDTLPDLNVLAPGLAAKGLVISGESEPPPSLELEPEPDSEPCIEDTIPTLFDSTRMEVPTPAPASPNPPAAQQPEVSQPVPPAATPRRPVPPTAPVQPAAPAATEVVGGDDVPDWEKDPTLAQLRPDIAALEQALKEIGSEEEKEEEKEPAPEIEVELKDPTLPGVPEITLDSAIDVKVGEEQQRLATERAEIEARQKKAEGNLPEPDPNTPRPTVQAPPVHPSHQASQPAPGNAPPKPATPPPASAQPAAPQPKSPDQVAREQQAEAQIDRIAADLARAKTLDDVDDKMAETLFGEEINFVAAQVVANPPDDVAANEAAPDTPAPESAGSTDAAPTPQPAEPEASDLEREFREVYGEDAIEVSLETDAFNGMDLSASQRLATVRALNAERNGPAGGATAAPPPKKPAPKPMPIEDQINTSMTQTLKTLNVRPPSSIVTDDDDEEERKSGFFSRFKRS